MKLKTKLIISFCIIIFVPIALGSGLFAMFMSTVDWDGTPNGLYHMVSTMTRLQARDMLSDTLLSILMILIFTAAILIMWIYSGIYKRVKELVTAADRIKEGNLEEPIRSKGDDEFSELSNALEEMRKRLQANAEEEMRLEEEQKALISNIAHDLKTPITAVKGYAEGLIDGVANTPEKQDAYIKTIYNKANEMNSLINELSLYSKIDTNKIPYNFAKVNANDFFMDCAEEIGLDLKSQDVDFTYYNYVQNGTMIIADPEQLERVVHNIISNSIKYKGNEKLEIRLTVSDVGDFIQVELQDNGKGIDQHDLPHIFERMYRADTSRNSMTGGSGIGLSIVQKIIEDHGGKIWAVSKLGEGTTMFFVLRKATD